MKNPLIYLFAAIMSVVSLSSCSSDDDKPVSSSKEIKYEITGEYSGTEPLDIVYTQDMQPIVTEATSLPWTKTYTASSGEVIGGFNVSGTGATPGEVITLKVYQGDTLLKSVDATATSDGIVIGSINANFN